MSTLPILPSTRKIRASLSSPLSTTWPSWMATWRSRCVASNCGNNWRKAPVLAHLAKKHRAQPQLRPDGQVNPTGEDNRHHDESQEPDFCRVANDVADIICGGKVPSGGIEVNNLEHYDEEQNGFVSQQQVFPSSVAGAHLQLGSLLPSPQTIGHDGEQNDEALDSLFPVRLYVQVSESWVDGRQQQQAREDTPEIATAA